MARLRGRLTTRKMHMHHQELVYVESNVAGLTCRVLAGASVDPTYHTVSPPHVTSYKQVLQGHIMLDQAVFPKGTAGCQLDTLARMPLWHEGLNYWYDTGHGVGATLIVHEGPQSISSSIRIENLVVIKEMDMPFPFGGQPYYGFEPLTMVLILTKLIDLSLMTDSDIHKKVRLSVSPRLQGMPEVLKWLELNTQPVSKAA